MQPPKILPLNTGLPPSNSNPVFLYFSILTPIAFSLKSSLSLYQNSLGRISFIFPVVISSSKYFFVYGNISSESSHISGKKA